MITRAPGLISIHQKSSTRGRPCFRASVIVVNHNGGDTIVPCLDSIERAADDTVEIIVVDNASADGSMEQVVELFPSVTCIRSIENLGFGGGNNLGARYAEGEYLVFANPDTIVTPGWWEALVEALAADPAIGMVTSRILLIDDPERLNTAGNDVHLTGLTLCRGMGRPAGEYDVPAIVSAVSGAAFAIRRDLFQQLCGFDEDFFLYMEETDLSWRAQLAGFECQYVPASKVYHHYRLRFGPNKTFYQERNRYRMLVKNLRWRTLFLLSPALLLAEIVTWGYVLVGDRHNWKGKIRAYGSLWADWPNIMQLRREIQSQRTVLDKHLMERVTAELDFAQTGEGLAATLAGWIFTPLFRIWRRFVLGVVWW